MENARENGRNRENRDNRDEGGNWDIREIGKSRKWRIGGIREFRENGETMGKLGK